MMLPFLGKKKADNKTTQGVSAPLIPPQGGFSKMTHPPIPAPIPAVHTIGRGETVTAKPTMTRQAQTEQQTISYQTKQKFAKGLTSIRDIIAPSLVEVDFDNIRVNNNYYRTLFVAAYPRYVSSNWLHPLLSFDKSLFISMYIYPTESRVILYFLKKKKKKGRRNPKKKKKKKKKKFFVPGGFCFFFLLCPPPFFFFFFFF